MKYPVIFNLVFLVVFIGCEKDVDLATLTTNTVSEITINSAKSGGTITSTGNGTIFSRGVCWSTSPNPSISNDHTLDGDGTGSFESTFTNLQSNTQYYVRAYAENEAGISYGESLSFETLLTVADMLSEGSTLEELWNDGISVEDLIEAGVTIFELFEAGIGVGLLQNSGVTEQELIENNLIGYVDDVDNNSYKWVLIGEQKWMAENLRVTHYADGTPIPLVTDNTVWANLGDNNTDDAYCWYYNDSESYAATYGALYTWAAAMGDNAVSSDATPSGIQGACPTGWHIPSDNEWTELYDYLSNNGYSDTDATVLKATSGWHDSGDGTNTFGFNALPAGTRYNTTGLFHDAGYLGGWWSATEYVVTHVFYRIMEHDYEDVYRGYASKSNGASVRCIMDQ